MYQKTIYNVFNVWTSSRLMLRFRHFNVYNNRIVRNAEFFYVHELRRLHCDNNNLSWLLFPYYYFIFILNSKQKDINFSTKKKTKKQNWKINFVILKIQVFRREKNRTSSIKSKLSVKYFKCEIYYVVRNRI